MPDFELLCLRGRVYWTAKAIVCLDALLVFRQCIQPILDAFPPECVNRRIWRLIVKRGIFRQRFELPLHSSQSSEPFDFDFTLQTFKLHVSGQQCRSFCLRQGCRKSVGKTDAMLGLEVSSQFRHLSVSWKELDRQ